MWVGPRIRTDMLKMKTFFILAGILLFASPVLAWTEPLHPSPALEFRIWLDKDFWQLDRDQKPFEVDIEGLPPADEIKNSK